MSKEMDEVLGGIEKRAQETVDRGEDMGLNKLLTDLVSLLVDAQNLEFHDYLNKKYAAPKQSLAMRLEEIRGKVLQGEYDN